MVTTALRIGAIIILISFLEKLPFNIENMSYSWETIPNISNLIYSLAPSILALIISFLMWFYPEALAPKFSTPIEDKANNSDKSTNIGEILISILGLYVLVHAISDFIYHAVLYLIFEKEKLTMPPYETAAFIATLFELVIGTFLLYGSGLIHRFIKQFKKSFL